MPEVISTVGILVGYAALQAVARGGTAISPEADTVRNAATALVRSAEVSRALFGMKAEAISGLRRLAMEHRQPGWDGEDAAAVSSVALLTAESFIRALPDGIPMPEFAAEPDGSISLDWIQSRQRLFTLTVGHTSRLAYAWIDGTDRGHAVALFDGASAPPRILEGIKSVLRPGYASLRAA
jgi:hypothetical protein